MIHGVLSRPAAMPGPQVRQTLLAWVRGAGAADPTNVPPFIRNKIAQLVVFVIQVSPGVLTIKVQHSEVRTQCCLIAHGRIHGSIHLSGSPSSEIPQQL